MKNLLLTFGLLMCFFAQAQEIKWMTMNEALEAQQKEPKKIFMDVYTDWCGPCKLLDKRTFHNKDVVEFVNKHYYAVKFNAEGTEEIRYNNFTYTNPNHNPNRKGRNSQHFFANALKITGYPSLVFFDENGKLITPVVGFKTPKQLEIYLKMVQNNDYKKLTTAEAWQDYEKSFVGTFSN
ncbi:thioredoxin fold domain-containing protein [Aquimarina sp. MMG016]|uniref:thioredoxin family protein n=1 Tax=Aquimarina sp. MMG016 TaxID=2822690 RepID=UPI001B3A0F8C|nr:thioredoxin fold domain-containing protein [Aquimarina sp. MMG016]MBQ4818801.1 thioredoxin fold domain-containing protein [Aquimarina sp. MMG016]